MIAPLWKRLLSYLFELHIESTSSEHNPHLYVSLKNGRYQLSTANAVYSYGDLYDNFSEAFQQLNLESREIKNVLILGFGLAFASVPFSTAPVLTHRSRDRYPGAIAFVAIVALEGGREQKEKEVHHLCRR